MGLAHDHLVLLLDALDIQGDHRGLKVVHGGDDHIAVSDLVHGLGGPYGDHVLVGVVSQLAHQGGKYLVVLHVRAGTSEELLLSTQHISGVHHLFLGHVSSGLVILRRSRHLWRWK